ncbi:hypothetical protein [Streptomyces chryseus]
MIALTVKAALSVIFSKITTKAAKSVILAAGILSTTVSPALAEDSTNGPGTITIIPNHAIRVWRHCAYPATEMRHLVMTPGPDVITARFREEPGGFGVDVINMSKTNTSWINFGYVCSKPDIEITKKVYVAGRTSMQVDWECPDGYQIMRNAGFRVLVGTNQENGLTYTKQGPYTDWVKFTFSNSNRIASELFLTATCGDA